MQTDRFFKFKRKGVVITKPWKMPKPGPYYPSLVKMNNLSKFPFDYALYFSTDHHRKRGGIWLYVCNGIPTKAENWKSYDKAVSDGDFDYLFEKPRKNPIYIDKIQGRHHTETPCVNIVDGKVYMTYHHSSSFGRQPTLLATSPDGVIFTRIHGKRDSKILPAKPNGGHTGYFRWAPNPFHRIAYKYIGYSLHGGGKNYHSALWGSNDVFHWDKVHIFTPLEGYAMKDDEMIMIWHEINPAAVERIGDDEYVLLSAGGNRAAGSQARVVKLYEIFLTGDGKTLTRESRQLLPDSSPKDLDNEERAEPTMVKIGDTWHLLYVGTTKKAKKNTIMAAIGTFHPDAVPSKKIN